MVCFYVRVCQFKNFFEWCRWICLKASLSVLFSISPPAALLDFLAGSSEFNTSVGRLLLRGWGGFRQKWSCAFSLCWSWRHADPPCFAWFHIIENCFEYIPFYSMGRSCSKALQPKGLIAPPVQVHIYPIPALACWTIQRQASQ